MPFAVIGAIVGQFVAQYVASYVMTSLLFQTLLRAGVSFVVGGLLRNVLSGSQKQQKADGDPIATSRGRLVTIRQPISPWQVVYGEVRVGGTMTFAHIGEDKRLIHVVVTLAGHVCTEIVDVYFNDELVTLDADGFGIGKWVGDGANPYVRVKRSLGDEEGQPFPDLVAESNGKWTDSWRQTGRTKLYVRLFANPELFPTGIPKVTAVVRGRKVYDPRTGAAAWSSNAALCANDYVTNTAFGIGATYAEEIDEATLIAAANTDEERVPLAAATAIFTAVTDADTLVVEAQKKLPAIGDGVRVASAGTLPAGLAADTTYYVIHAARARIKLAATFADALAGTAIDITDAGTGEHTLTYHDEARYTANGAFTVSAEPKRVLGMILAAHAGKAVNVGGAWMQFAGAYEAPTITLDDGDLAGGIRVQTLVSRRENANGIKGTFTDPNSHWQPVSFPPVASAAYMAEDGERVWSDINLEPFVTSGTQAQRLAKLELLSLRQGLTVEGDFKLTAWRAQTGRTVALSVARFGWTDKPFEVVGSQFSIGEDGTLGVRLNLRETAAAVFDWSTSEEQVVDIAPNTDLPDIGVIAAPGTPAVAEELYETRDGRGVAAKAVVSWGASTYPYGPQYQLEYKRAADTEYTVLPITRGTQLDVLDLEPDSYNFRVKAFAVTGAGSSYSDVATRQIMGLGARPAEPSGLAIQAIGGQALITFTQHPELDVRRGGRILVRHCEDTGAPTWEESFSIGNEDGYSGDAVYVLVPLKAGAYLLKAQDSSGQQSEDAATVDTRQASVLAFSSVGSVTEDPSFPGTHASTVRDGSTLKLAGSGLFDDIPDLDAAANLDSFGGIVTSGTYTFSTGIDLGSVQNVRLTGLLQGATVNVLDAIDDRDGNIDDWLDFDGATGGGSTDAYLETRQTDDDPAGAPGWSSWTRLDAAEKRARAFQFRLQMLSNDAAYNQTITQLRVTAEQVS